MVLSSSGLALLELSGVGPSLSGLCLQMMGAVLDHCLFPTKQRLSSTYKFNVKNRKGSSKNGSTFANSLG
jgi:hypothetical protein